MSNALRKALSALLVTIFLLGAGAPAAFAWSEDVTVTFTRHTDSCLEWAEVTALAPGGNVLWTYRTGSYAQTELYRINDVGACNGAYYIVEGGTVVALDMANGAVRWKNSNFGGSAYASAFGADGVLYLCGYYGPDLFAVDMDGNVVKRMDTVAAGYARPYEVCCLETGLLISFEVTPSGQVGALYVDPDADTGPVADAGTVYSAIVELPVTQNAVCSVTATSYLDEPQYGLSHTASNLVDGSLAHAWVEGVSGQGEGEALTLHLDGVYRISGMAIYAGYQKSEAAYANNSRPAAVSVSFSDGSSLNVRLQDHNGQQIVAFPHGVDTTSVTLTIQSVYPGALYEDTVISEIVLY